MRTRALEDLARRLHNELKAKEHLSESGRKDMEFMNLLERKDKEIEQIKQKAS